VKVTVTMTEANFPHTGPRKGHHTFHLTASEVWDRQKSSSEYLPEAFEADGFIHCTDDPVELLLVGDRYYRDDSRDFLALTIECDLVPSLVVYEDVARRFPHIYGPLPITAVTGVQAVERGENGAFVRLKSG
jgi:uncharacterized protein (DUF952 family)